MSSASAVITPESWCQPIRPVSPRSNFVRHIRFRYLDVRVLHRNRVDFRTDELLDDIQQTRTAQQIKHNWSVMAWRFFRDINLRQRNIEVLIERLLGFQNHPDKTLTKRQIPVGRFEQSSGMPTCDQTVKQTFVLLDHRLDVLLLVQCPTGDHVTVVCKLLQDRLLQFHRRAQYVENSQSRSPCSTTTGRRQPIALVFYHDER